jgi:hypothetical protein
MLYLREVRNGMEQRRPSQQIGSRCWNHERTDIPQVGPRNTQRQPTHQVRTVHTATDKVVQK